MEVRKGIEFGQYLSMGFTSLKKELSDLLTRVTIVISSKL
jgi:hypothetical protein